MVGERRAVADRPRLQGLPLDSIEWHDLPVSGLAIDAAGITLTIACYDEALATYRARLLQVVAPATVRLAFDGELHGPDLMDELEVTSFQYQTDGAGATSGTLSLVVGNNGRFEISFARSRCLLHDA